MAPRRARAPHERAPVQRLRGRAPAQGEPASVRVGGQDHRRGLGALDRRRARASSIARARHRRKPRSRARSSRRSATRLGFLLDVGLDYLTLDRAARDALGRRGAAHPARDADRLGPDRRALHPRRAVDRPPPARQRAPARRRCCGCATSATRSLVVEHDRDTILAADHVIDMGPGAGVHGGRGRRRGHAGRDHGATRRRSPAAISSGAAEIPVPRAAARRHAAGRSASAARAPAQPARTSTVEIPLGTMTCVTGVSGSGKSTLVIDTLYRALAQRLGRQHASAPARTTSSSAGSCSTRSSTIDQAPIGRTPRSNPATYTGLFAPIRELFAQLPEARARGYEPGRFSFNVKGGRCEACAGDGVIAHRDALPARRLRHLRGVPGPALRPRDAGGQATGARASPTCSTSPSARRSSSSAASPPSATQLDALREVGLDYVRLGQPATTLSGGEAQRIKLGRELARRATGRTLYILDEPTTGLHFEDVRRLLDVLERLVDPGNTVVVIEHNLDVIKTADYVHRPRPRGRRRRGPHRRRRHARGGRRPAERIQHRRASSSAASSGQAVAARARPAVAAD